MAFEIEEKYIISSYDENVSEKLGIYLGEIFSKPSDSQIISILKKFGVVNLNQKRVSITDNFYLPSDKFNSNLISNLSVKGLNFYFKDKLILETISCNNSNPKGLFLVIDKLAKGLVPFNRTQLRIREQIIEDEINYIITGKIKFGKGDCDNIEEEVYVKSFNCELFFSSLEFYLSSELYKQKFQKKFVGEINGDNLSVEYTKIGKIKDVEFLEIEIVSKDKKDGLIDKVRDIVKVLGIINPLENAENRPYQLLQKLVK